ncbi:MAG TPA: phospholipase D-like domain-containing protein, partial [Thermoanaerobaculia bacterium]|nr:phospholipase D-like domain-containing protein [Thermoanaerobaculia bacterium]
ADDLETCTLFFIAAINAATTRLWIASPYFVPDEQFITAVQLAALRGVDVRILIPKNNDNVLVGLSMWSYLQDLEGVGVRFYRYTRGFMHQKVTLIDDRYCTIGTANFDNRSFRLNFEITMGIADDELASHVRAMLESDFAHAERICADDLRKRSFAFRFAVRAARLAAPVQ